MLKIIGVDKNGVGKKAGLKVGDQIVTIEGYPAIDSLDFIFYEDEPEFSMQIFTAKGKKKTIKIKKRAPDPMGLEFEDITPRRCKNKCKFCFVDQLPKGMRDTLYVKDDDYRHSFISGNYITLTNVTDADIDRIIRLKLSPLYISVHAYDNDVRKLLVTNPATVGLIDKMKKLAKAGIIMHTQVVLCDGINDGEVLQNTMEGLYEMYPAVKSLAVVPVGLTRHRLGLFELKPLSEDCVEDTIERVEKFNEGKNFCWCSDEFYIKAGLPVPRYDYYGNFDQIENGVGLVAKFNRNIDDALAAIKPKDMGGKRITLITGKSFERILNYNVYKIKQKLTGINITVKAIENNYFGRTITVAGLITGGDILSQTERGADMYIIPHNMLKEFEDVFLDSITLAEVKKELGRVEVSDSLGENLVSLIASI